MGDVVNTGSSDNDGTGDKLRDAFRLVNVRFQDLLGTINGRGAWATGVVYNATPARDWVIQGGQAYAAVTNHTSGVFATDLAAGLWVAVDVLQLINDLAASGGSDLIGFIQAGAGAVVRTNQDKLRDSLDAADFGVVYDGVTDSTIAMQKALDAGHNIYISGPVAHGPLSVSRTVKLMFSANASITPLFSAGLPQSLYLVTAPKVVIEDFRVTAYAQTLGDNKYLIRADFGGDDLQIVRPKISGVTASDGNLGDTNLLVCHAIYTDGVSNLRVIDGDFSGISGAAVFIRTGTGYTITRNKIHNTGWYSIMADRDCFDGEISYNRISGDDVNCRNWGGSVNLQSNTIGGKNKRCKVVGNTFSGVHNYGAVVRIQSAEDVEVTDNTFDRCTSGALLPSPLQYVAITRRGTAEGEPENGPCINVSVSDNIMRAGLGIHWAVYLQNQHLATRSPHENIQIEGNIITSVDAANCFSLFAVAHGFKSGIKRLLITGNTATVYTQAGSPGGAALGILATQSSGVIDEFEVFDNSFEDLTSGAPNASHQIGVYVQTHSQNGMVRGNTFTNFRYGYRQAASLLNIRGGNDNTFIRCLDDALMSGQPAGGGFDMSIGSTLPTNGVYRVGHIRQNPTAAASSSYGWVVTTAGGAMTGAWTTGLTYVDSEWIRNAAGRVYELITAGGGTVSVEPTHTTVGQDVTGADGYVWRCRATTSARWATMPALGTVVALP